MIRHNLVLYIDMVLHYLHILGLDQNDENERVPEEQPAIKYNHSIYLLFVEISDNLKLTGFFFAHM